MHLSLPFPPTSARRSTARLLLGAECREPSAVPSRPPCRRRRAAVTASHRPLKSLLDTPGRRIPSCRDDRDAFDSRSWGCSPPVQCRLSLPEVAGSSSVSPPTARAPPSTLILRGLVSTASPTGEPFHRPVAARGWSRCARSTPVPAVVVRSSRLLGERHWPLGEWRLTGVVVVGIVAGLAGV